ncbi:hypothetical protein FAM09_10520 [Niastella caeni]|uniref:Uncharacterized protein n=1 Tax=Niastella caeni TaxID=2569763 RepID=A0A4S8I2W2_9BACT|nr:hypothetical protein [Niastella caeni]THU40292.1 hypothetical protein FAM09_10520 [Niastella caeni]
MRRKKPAMILATLFLAAFAMIAVLAFLSKNIHEKKNGFNRRLHTVLKLQKQITFPVSISRIIGSHENKLYFQGNDPYKIYLTDRDLNFLKIIPLSISPDVKLNSGVRMLLNGHHIYLSCRNMPGIIDYDLDSGTSDSHVLKYFYNKEAVFSKDQFILRTKDLKTNDPVFIKLDLKNENARVEDRFSEKNGKGSFSTDGILYYDSTSHLACYTFFYQNGFICMDTNLNIKLKARTIDTVTKREIKVARLASSLTMKEPPQFVNYTGAVAGGTLYLHSMLKADNEYSLDFMENTVIDVYNLINGAYKGSFYIPAHKGNKLHQLHVIDKKLYAIYGKSVVLYDLNITADPL